MAMASSTARWLSTGSEPGRPRQFGHTLVLGSSPNTLGQPQNSLVAVLSSQWTSSPMTSCQSALMPAPPAVMRGAARSGAAASTTAATWNRVPSDRAGPSSCTPTGRPSSPGPNGTLMAGWPARLDGMVHTSDRYMVSGSSTLAPRAKAVVGAVGPEQDVAAGVGGGEALDDPGADPQGLVVIGVHVAGRQHVGAEHDPALDLGAEPLRTGWRCSWPPCPRRRPAARSARRRSGPGWRRPRPGRSGSRRTGRG